MAYIIVLILECWLVYKYKGNLELLFLKWKKPYFVISILTVLIFSVGAMMSVIGGVGIFEGIGMLADRAFLIPAGTSSYYYYLFPSTFPYRGILRTFTMLGKPPDNDVGTFLIAETITNGYYSYNPNACLLATAFSAAGFLGVLLVSCVYCALASSADWLLNRLEPRLRFIGILINVHGMVGLISTPLYASFASYGFGISGWVFYLLTRRKKKT